MLLDRPTKHTSIKPSHLGLICIVSILTSCVEEAPNKDSSSNTCYYSLDFSDLPSSEDKRLAEVSMNLHDNYFMYKNMEAMPLRFDNKIFLSLDCDRRIKSLELDNWMRNFIDEFSELNQINSEEYDSMFEQATSGVIVVQ